MALFRITVKGLSLPISMADGTFKRPSISFLHLIFCIVNPVTSSPDAMQTNPTIVVKHSDYGGLLK